MVRAIGIMLRLEAKTIAGPVCPPGRPDQRARQLVGRIELHRRLVGPHRHDPAAAVLAHDSGLAHPTAPQNKAGIVAQSGHDLRMPIPHPRADKAALPEIKRRSRDLQQRPGRDAVGAEFGNMVRLDATAHGPKHRRCPRRQD